jgi:hypothetical protein
MIRPYIIRLAVKLPSTHFDRWWTALIDKPIRCFTECVHWMSTTSRKHRIHDDWWTLSELQSISKLSRLSLTNLMSTQPPRCR